MITSSERTLRLIWITGSLFSLPPLPGAFGAKAFIRQEPVHFNFNIGPTFGSIARSLPPAAIAQFERSDLSLDLDFQATDILPASAPFYIPRDIARSPSLGTPAFEQTSLGALSRDERAVARSRGDARSLAALARSRYDGGAAESGAVSDRQFVDTNYAREVRGFTDYKAIQDQDEFKKFAAKYRKAHGGRETSQKLLDLFFRDYFGGLTEPHLSRLQNNSLSESLRLHGGKATARDARADLISISRANRKRLNPNVRYKRTPEMAAAEKTVARLEFRFIHNTHVLSRQPKVPILSSRRIETLDGRGGLNSDEFNKEVLRSDDDVFFVVVPTLDGKLPARFRTIYGDNAAVLDPRYAQEKGWISHWVMYPWDLERFAQSPASGIEESPVFAMELEEETLQRKHLSRLDFNTEEFTAGVRERLLYELARMARDSRGAFRKYISKLKSGEAESIQQVLQELVFDKWGLEPDNSVSQKGETNPYSIFELKVPVAVPPDKINVLPAK